MNVHIPQNLSVLRRLIRERQAVLENLGRGLAEKGVRGEEQYHYTGGCISPWRRLTALFSQQGPKPILIPSLPDCYGTRDDVSGKRFRSMFLVALNVGGGQQEGGKHVNTV